MENVGSTSNPELFVTEDAAAAYAGVSTSTLHKFVEAGYLRTEKSDIGDTLLSTTEIYRVFGRDPNRPFSGSQSKSAKQERQTSESEEIVERSTLSSEVEVEPIDSGDTNNTHNVNGSSMESEEISLSIVEPYESEISRLKTSIVLLEQMLQMKESTISDLKEEKQWLKDRIERLEEQNAREATMLFTATQTMQRVIENNQRKPAMQSVLEFFGFVPVNRLPMQQTPAQTTESAFARKD